MLKNEIIILLALSLCYELIGLYIDQPTIQSLGMMGWFGIVQLIYSVRSWLKRGNQLISPYIIFLFSLYIFSYGQSFLWAFNLDFDRTLIDFYGITEEDIFDAQVLTLIMLAFFHIGATYFMIYRKENTHKTIVRRESVYRLKVAGWFLFVISVGPYVSETIQDMLLSMTKGYGAIFGEGKVGLDNLSGFLAEYFMPSVICLFIAYKGNKLMMLLIVIILLANVVVLLLTGGRSNAVIILSLLVVLFNYLVKRFTKKWLIVGTLSVFIILQLLSYVASVRTEEGRSASFEGIKFENNAAVDAVAEMGSSMFCLIKTKDLVPSKEPYRYGKSYAYAFTTIIPNLNFWKIHPAKKESNLSEWLTETLDLDYGTGFSMCAEAFANFGYMGFIVFFFWGWFLASIFGKIEISMRTRNYALMAFLLILFWYFLKLPRNNFINLVRPLFYVAGPIYLFCTQRRKH